MSDGSLTRFDRIGLGKSQKRRTVVEKPYHIVSKESTQELAKWLATNGQMLLPMVELIEPSKMAVDELIEVMGRAQIEAVLRLSAERVAGPPHPGKKGGAVGWHGRERGAVCLKERKLRVERPRLRKKGKAVGVDAEGQKHVLGLAAGATENQVLVRGLLEDLVRRGLKVGRRYLFVVDGSKALRIAIDAVFGSSNPVQRCRNHKIENVMGYLPEHLKDQVKAAMRAAFRRSATEGMRRLEKQAEWLDGEYPSAAASLREGLAEMFTVNRLGLPPSLARCLVTTNLIESPHSGVKLRTRKVCRWRDGQMVLRWAAAALLMTEKHFRKIMGYRDLWMLKAALDENQTSAKQRVA